MHPGPSSLASSRSEEGKSGLQDRALEGGRLILLAHGLGLGTPDTEAPRAGRKPRGALLPPLQLTQEGTGPRWHGRHQDQNLTSRDGPSKVQGAPGLNNTGQAGTEQEAWVLPSLGPVLFRAGLGCSLRGLVSGVSR